MRGFGARACNFERRAIRVLPPLGKAGGWEQVQVYLGHNDIATTRKYYVHLFGDDLPERGSVLDAERTRSLLAVHCAS